MYFFVHNNAHLIGSVHFESQLFRINENTDDGINIHIYTHTFIDT